MSFRRSTMKLPHLLAFVQPKHTIDLTASFGSIGSRTPLREKNKIAVTPAKGNSLRWEPFLLFVSIFPTFASICYLGKKSLLLFCNKCVFLVT